MKKLITFLIVFSTVYLSAEQISLDKAKLVATNFLTSQNSNKQNLKSKVKAFNQITLTQITQLTKNNSTIFKSKSTVADTSLLYIFNVNDNQGFIVISGNDVTIPVLAYAEQGKIEEGNVPDGLMFFLNNYSEQLNNLKKNPIVQSSKVKVNWANLSTGILKKVASAQNSVAPLLDSLNIKWGQSGAFNYDFPKLNDNNEAYTGCVTTAIAQLLKFWSLPKNGFGYYSNQNGNIPGLISAVYGNTIYNWDNMPGSYELIDAKNPNNDELVKIKEVSNLMKQIGISINTNYIEGGSNAKLEDVPRALNKNFGYSDNITYIDKFLNGTSDTEWESIIINELKWNRPVIYSGLSYFPKKAGHAFVCDGFKSTNNINYFNFNWGWDGKSNITKTYCTISSIIPSDKDYNFKYFQSAVIGIKPKKFNNIDLQLKKIEITNKTINSNTNINVEVYNNDITDYNGSLYIAIFNKNFELITDRNIIDNIQIKKGTTFCNTFSYNSIKLLPGRYYISVFYKLDGFEGVALDIGNKNNYIEINFQYAQFNDKLLIKEPINFSDNKIIKNAPFNVSAKIINDGLLSFSGKIGIGIFNNNEIQQIIDEQTIIIPALPYNNEKIINFYSQGINVKSGYYLFCIYKRTTEGEVFVLDSIQYSSKNISVISPPDPYESNDIVNDAFIFNLLESSSNNYHLTTTNANIMSIDDFDYYKIILPSGYKFCLNTSVYDSNHQTSNNDLTCDVVCRIYYNSQWHNQFDKISSDTLISNGSPIYFLIESKDGFQSGSYILDINIEKLSGVNYSVTVPSGTNACYIAGTFNSWNPSANPMTKVDDTHYTINFPFAQNTDQYKYLSGPGWGYQEKDNQGNDIANRTYTNNDIVAKWALVYQPTQVKTDITYSVTVPTGTKKCYISGGMTDWGFVEMSKTGSNSYTITINSYPGFKYKYCSGPSWNYEELSNTGTSISDRSWSASDVVASWKAIYSPVTTPSVSTAAITNITTNSATSGGNIIDTGGAVIIQKGICWNNTGLPTTNDNNIINNTVSTNFTCDLSSLNPNTTYYIRAYATNSVGTSYGNEITFNTNKNNSENTVTDFDGNVYNTIKIGNQLWMAENLKVTHYRNGDPIPNVNDNTAWRTTTNGAFCFIDNDINKSNVYGNLYNWYAVADNRNIAPNGWHVPSDSEWETLINYLGGSSSAGAKLKESGMSHWVSPIVDATNVSGFTALPSGSRDNFGFFSSSGSAALFWSSTEYGNTAWYRVLYNMTNTVNRLNYIKSLGHSVRCVSDYLTTDIRYGTKNSFFNIFPNPTSDELYIEIKSNETKMKIEIYNIFGQIIFTNYFFNKSMVSLKNFSNGIYLIKVGNEVSFETVKVLKK